MSKKKLPPKFVKAPAGGELDSPLRPTGEPALMVAPEVLPSDGFVHAVAARFTVAQGEALAAAAKADGVTVEALLRKLVEDWMQAQPAKAGEQVGEVHTHVGQTEPMRARSIIEAVMEKALGTLARFGLRSQGLRSLAGWLSPSSVSR